MLIRFLLAILVLAAVLLAGSLILPSKVHVERSIEVSRAPSVVFLLLNDFEHFQQWSPWAEKDPNATYQFGDKTSGVGARLSWSGDPRAVGTGWQEITQSQPNSLVRTHLSFEDHGEADAYFEIRPVGRGSRVEWGFDTDMTEGKNFFVGAAGKYMGLLVDYWVGQDFSSGLSQFKQYAESFPEMDIADLEIEIVEAQPQNILFVSSSSGKSNDAIAAALGAAYGEISRFMNSRGIKSSGMPMSITRSWNEQGYAFDAAIPVDNETVNTTGSVQFGQSPSGKAVRAIHRGPYSKLRDTYDTLDTYFAVHRFRRGDVSWEHYISDPGNTEESNLITHIYVKLAE